MSEWVEGLKATFAARQYRIGGITIFCVALPTYLMTLASEYTGGVIGPAALKYLDAKMIVFSLIMSTLVTLLLPVMFYLMRHGFGTTKSSATGGVAIGVLTPLLCCSPLLPLILGFVATFFPALVEMIGWQLQKFIVTHSTELYSLASVLLLVALYQNARRVACGPVCSPRGRSLGNSV
ncbi:MAG: hypothetical protein DRQ59_14445 [Gammaproteobacteria bacterium]|nr:MAG: hypothetical protein DRQ59_14445 [Gammaproteobacteria bacterium]